MTKNTKIWLNYLAGAAISLFLFWSIYNQLSGQKELISSISWTHTGSPWWLCLSILLMFINSSLESLKWYMLTNSVEPVGYARVLASYLAGISFSIITPNRIGEYPGRILYLGRSNTFRYINVSVLGIMAQLSGIYLFGLVGLVYYNLAFPSVIAKAGLAVCLIVNIFIGIFYWKFEFWLPLMARIKWLRRFATYGRLLNRITTKSQFMVLGISLLRFMVFSAQYLSLLRWMNVIVPPLEGFCLAALFFWIMAVIPGIALTELGIRGKVSLFLFQAFSAGSLGILAATGALWLLNLIVPSLIGGVLIWRMRWLQ